MHATVRLGGSSRADRPQGVPSPWRSTGSPRPRGTRVVPAAGRTHQIRVHLSERAGASILADRVYGRVPVDKGLAAAASELGRQALHAAVLGFVHPVSGERLRFESPLPADMQRALERLRAE
jgi:23S rRNA pseudouridine1911/1915/1917 synthase